jgi:hypothetical protein
MTYRREDMLSKFSHILTSDEIEDESLLGRQAVVALLKPQRRKMIELGRAMHWAYDISIHHNLQIIINEETAAIAAMKEKAK